MLASVYSYRVMVKVYISSCCVRGRQVISNPVTYVHTYVHTHVCAYVLCMYCTVFIASYYSNSMIFFVNRIILKATIILLPLLGITWAFGLLAVNQESSVFAWIFTILNSLQVRSYKVCICTHSYLHASHTIMDCDEF